MASRLEERVGPVDSLVNNAVCQPSDVAAVVRFLVSGPAGYLSGQRICVDAAARAAEQCMT
jgi:NAD(P)-dependent dehydrogenase (short-subunit alcohol dehydrogenase family)